MWNPSLIRENKARARALLYLPLVLLFVGWVVLKVAFDLGVDPGWLDESYEDSEAVQIFRDYLKIDTSYPYGNEIPGAEFLARHLEAAGIPVVLERLGHRNANLWAVVEGRDRAPLVLHNHIDVEPVRYDERWRFPPFGGMIYGPFLYGRGAFDMKSVAIAQLMAILEIQRSGKKPARSVAFLATGDEERDSRLGTKRWLETHPEIAREIHAVLTEGGAVEAVNLEKVRYWGTEHMQRHFVDVWVCDADRERLDVLRQELIEHRYGTLRAPSPDVADFLRRYGPSREHPEVQAMLESPETVLYAPQRDLLPPRVLASLRNELAIFPILPDADGGWSMRVILHLLPDVQPEVGYRELIGDRLVGFTYEMDVQHPPVPSSSPEHPVFVALEEFMVERFPEAAHGPLFVPWSATDARYFRTSGIPSYGYSPFWILSSDAVKMKGANERISVPAFLDGVEVYTDLVGHLVGAEG